MASRRALNIALLPGDGIGKEVIPAAAQALETVSSLLPHLHFTFQHLPVGFGAFQESGSALPDKTLATLHAECHGALFGAVSSPSYPVKGYSSPIVGLRRAMDLYANVRPVKSVGCVSRMVSRQSQDQGQGQGQAQAQARRDAEIKGVDMVIVRENTEDLDVKEERTFTGHGDAGLVAEAIKRISEKASRRIARMAGEIALRRGAMRNAASASASASAATATATATEREGEGEGDNTRHREAMVTITHKSNVLSQTDGLFRSLCREELEAERFKTQGLRVEEQIVDSMVYKLFRQPQYYDVIVAPNLYGDILSDGAAALVGSLGVVPSANVGDDFVIGEPCHGSAPDIQGKGIANPIAAIRSAGCMLEFMGEVQAAGKIYDAVDEHLRAGKVVAVDLGGKHGTRAVVEDILSRMR